MNELIGVEGGGKGGLHQPNSNLEHVILQCKIREAAPGAMGPVLDLLPYV